MNLHPAWEDFAAATELRVAYGDRPLVVLNDADAAGLAEARHGAGRGCDGTTLMLTFGTGIGSALLSHGTLVRGAEFGQLMVDGRPAERLAAAVQRTASGLTWEQWAAAVNRYLAVVEGLAACSSSGRRAPHR